MEGKIRSHITCVKEEDSELVICVKATYWQEGVGCLQYIGINVSFPKEEKGVDFEA